MDLFSQISDYNPPSPRIEKRKMPERANNQIAVFPNPEPGFAILLEDVVSMVSQYHYGSAGDSCKIIAHPNGPLIVLEGKHGRFHVKIEKVKQQLPTA